MKTEISHSKDYRFITQKSTSFKNMPVDQSLYILIKILDGNNLYDESKDNFIELISKFNEFGFLPRINQSFISEQIERTNKIKQNELKEIILHQNYEELRNIINNEHITFLELPDGITDIPDFAFVQCSSLKEVILSNTVNSIENYEFYRCSSLASIFILSTVKSIGKGCFSHCKKLRNIKIPNSLEIINDHVFDGCSSLEELIIPENVKSI